MTDDKRKMAEQTAKTLGCRVRYLSAGKVNNEDTIEKWLANFRDSVFVITDSYHGTVFSLLFQKQFYCFYNKFRGNARMDSIKELTGLNTRFIQESLNLQEDKIDYVTVNVRLNEMSEKNIEWLSKSLIL